MSRSWPMRLGSPLKNHTWLTGEASSMWPMRSRRTRARDLDAALVAHDAGELHALVLAARALVVLGRPEDAGAEQPVALGLERPVVDGLRLLHLAVRPVADLLGRGELDANRVERDGLRMPIEDAPQVLGRLFLSDQAAERPIRQHSVLLLTMPSCRPSSRARRRGPGSAAPSRAR